MTTNSTEFDSSIPYDSNLRTDAKNHRTGHRTDIEPAQSGVSVKALALKVLARKQTSNQPSNSYRTDRFEPGSKPAPENEGSSNVIPIVRYDDTDQSYIDAGMVRCSGCRRYLIDRCTVDGAHTVEDRWRRCTDYRAREQTA